MSSSGDAPSRASLLLACSQDAGYFLHHAAWLFDATERAWLPFHLWPAQLCVLDAFQAHRLHVILKARQLGLSWLSVGYALWLMLVEPGSVVLLFSRRDDEARELLARLKGMNRRLPPWLRQPLATDKAHEAALANGSRALSFATTRHSARSFTASLVIVDEAHFIPWFGRLLAAVKPTIDAGGRLILLSTANKEEPGGEFPRLFLEAEKGLNGYHATFLPWHARPGRDAGWYEAQRRDYGEDDLKQEYPATPAEAQAPRASRKRFRPEWLDRAHVEVASRGHSTPTRIYRAPEAGRRYLIAADPAEGNPTSDPSAAIVLDVARWEEAAVLHGRFETDIFASYLITLALHYDRATIVPERNNHGHAVIDNIRSAGEEGLLYLSPFDGKAGWLSNAKYKTLAVDNAATLLREGGVVLHTRALVNELALFDAATLHAPGGFHSDLAMALIVGLAALRWPTRGDAAVDVLIPAPDPLERMDRGGF